MRVAILGTGLIGGSLGLALRSLSPVERVVAFDADSERSRLAVARGAADEFASSPARAVAGADVVFVATPVRSIVPVIRECLSEVRPGAVLTDVGSTKSRVVLEVEAAISSSAEERRPHFIGGHPMAGSEQEGIQAARADLFDGAWWILTPGESAQPEAFRTLQRLLTAIGARVMALEPTRHDELMAVISHIPQLTASTLMNLATARNKEDAGVLALAAGGFRDLTRIAASNPDLWVEICLENRDAIASALDELIERLQSLNAALRVGNGELVVGLLAAARDARRTLGKKPAMGDLVEVHVEIPDRPGVLADVTRIVGDLGINIEDVSISHATEGGRGSLHLSVADGAVSTRVQVALAAHGYRALIIKS